MIAFENKKIECNIPLKNFINIPDPICYPDTNDNFNNIINDICGLLNSEKRGGIIIIGVNEGGFCVGCKYQNTKWAELMVKLSKLMFAIIVSNNNEKFTYNIRMYPMNLENKCKFMSIITVSGKNATYFVNNNGDISSYIRKDGKTIVNEMDDEMLEKVRVMYLFSVEHIKKENDIGDKYAGEESEELEFKLSINGLMKGKDGIGKYFSSFGNTKGGKLVIGVRDDGIIDGVRIENSEEWDRILRRLLNQQQSINNLDFLKSIRVNRVPLNRKFMYLLEVIIPKNEGLPILVRDGDGIWNKWVRVLSSSLKDDRQILYTQKDYQDMQNKHIISEAAKNKLERENIILKKSITALDKRTNDVIIEIKEERKIMTKYCENILTKYKENLFNNQKYKKDLFYISFWIISGFSLKMLLDFSSNIFSNYSSNL